MPWAAKSAALIQARGSRQGDHVAAAVALVAERGSPTAAGSARQGRITTVQVTSAMPASAPQSINGRRQAAGSPIRSSIGPVSEAATIEPLINPEA